MKVHGSSLLTDIPFQEMFRLSHNDILEDFWVRESHVPTTRRPPQRHREGMQTGQGRPREYVIPIHVERADGTFTLQQGMDTDDCVQVIGENFNNNSVTRRERVRREAMTSTSPGSSGSHSSSCHRNTGASTFPVSREKQLATRELFGNSIPKSARRAGMPSKTQSEDFIDLSLADDDYEDNLSNQSSDIFIVESSSQTVQETKCVHDNHSAVAKQPAGASGSSITPTPSYPVYADLKPRLARDGRQIDYIRGDGNCFFRALSKEIYGCEEFHDDVRQAVVDLIEKYPQDFEQYLDTGAAIFDHIKAMRKTSTWASSAEIYAAATLLKRDIFVLSPNHNGSSYNWMLFSPPFSYAQDTSYHPCFITLCHTHGNHYDRIAPLMGKCNCDHDPPVLTGVKAYVDLTDSTEDEIV